MIRRLELPAWGAVATERGAHPHQLPVYAAASGVGSWSYALESSDADGGVLLPLWEHEPGVVASLYGYAGPLWWGTGVAGHLARLIDHVRDEGAVSLFLRTCPQRRLPLDAFEALVADPRATMVDQSPSVEVDVRAHPDDLWSRLRKSTRRSVRKLIEAGYTWSVLTSDSPLIAQFARMHAERMLAFGAPGAVFKRRATLEMMADPSIDCVVVIIHAPDGTMAAGQMFLGAGGMVDVADGAQSPEHTKDSPLKLADWQTLLWAHVNGYRSVHLGGGVSGRAESLIDYKLSLGGRRIYDCTWRLVLDEDAFRARSAEAGVEPCADRYFPPWLDGVPEPYEELV